VPPTAAEKVTFHFCPECGTSVYWDLEARPDAYGVAVGGFADPTFDSPRRAVWAENRHAWAADTTQMPTFQKGAAVHPAPGNQVG
jgi:hypothetical protein